MMDKELIKKLLGLIKFDDFRISTIYLSISSARIFATSNIFSEETDNAIKKTVIENGLNYQFLFSGILNYLIFLEQVGSLFTTNKKLQTTLVNTSDIYQALSLYSNLDEESKSIIYELRNSFAHRFGLATQNKKLKSFKFTLTFTKSDSTNHDTITKAKVQWDGDFSKKSDDYNTEINVKNFFLLCENIYSNIIKEVKNGNIKIKDNITIEEVLSRFTIIEN